MEQTYGMHIGKKMRRLLEIWNRQAPVDAWEIARNRKIMAIQGNGNPFVGLTTTQVGAEFTIP